jgi:hypothetical protein
MRVEVGGLRFRREDAIRSNSEEHTCSRAERPCVYNIVILHSRQYHNIVILNSALPALSLPQ